MGGSKTVKSVKHLSRIGLLILMLWPTPIMIIVLRKHKQNIWISQPGIQLAYNICY